MNDRPRLIETAFPLKQASLDSVHEKNVRHGHISTLHIWPARRPLAACRAALIATLLPDPGDPEERRRILEKLAGKVVKVEKKKKMPSGKIEVQIAEETVGGILHWGRESNPDLDWFRRKIREAYGGRAPRVLDPFAGGGAIPLEAMRLGCEVTALDINPVAWFILKCTLEYPQRLAGQHRTLPKFALESPEFMAQFFKGTAKLTKKQLERNLDAVQSRLFPPPDVDLSWHVRAWGWWVLQRAKKDLERFYPVVDGKPTVAYLWARTVTCKNCRATIPLLKTQWLCRKGDKRVLLTMKPNAKKTGVVFDVQANVPAVGGNAAQRREHDKRIGQGTMSRNGAWCPFCGQPATVAMEMEDIRQEGLAERLGSVMTAVVVDGQSGKEYRVPGATDIDAATKLEVERTFGEVPFGLPDEFLPGKEALGFRVPLYGIDRWYKLFTSRQLVAIGTFLKYTRAVPGAMRQDGYPSDWTQAVQGYLAMALDRLADRSSMLCRPDPTPTQSGVINTFSRFALPMNWDFIEGVTIQTSSGGYPGALEWVAKVAEQSNHMVGRQEPRIIQMSATLLNEQKMDIVVTDPPYYDAIPYSDLMDFFYVWLRRTLHGLSPEIDAVFSAPLAPKWDHQKYDGELIDDASRFDGDKARSKKAYEDGMARAFEACHHALKPEGRLVIVFAHKDPEAWGTLVSAVIKAGFVVDANWPIQTEMGNRTRALTSAALSSSVWLVCKKRSDIARPGWDNRVLEEMREKIAERLREFWDAGIRGPDFVWAATGPALEAYSRHPVVKKANEPGKVMEVAEFLRHVRRIVVDFVVGRVLSAKDGDEAVSGLDDVTTYYLLHRNDFKLDDAPIGPCILYAVSCGLSDGALADQYDILVRTGGQADAEEEERTEEAGAGDAEPEEGTGSTVKLKPWNQRKRPGMGYDPSVDSPRARQVAATPFLFPDAEPPAPKAREIPLIDQIHRLMHLWRAGDVVKVDDYLDIRGLRRSELFRRILQALIELAPAGSEERSLLESISNHVAARGEAAKPVPVAPGLFDRQR